MTYEPVSPLHMAWEKELRTIKGEDTTFDVFVRGQHAYTNDTNTIFKCDFELVIPVLERTYYGEYKDKPTPHSMRIIQHNTQYGMLVGAEPYDSPMPELRIRLKHPPRKTPRAPIQQQLGNLLCHKDQDNATDRCGDRWSWGATRCRWMAYMFVDVMLDDWFFRGGQGCAL